MSDDFEDIRVVGRKKAAELVNISADTWDRLERRDQRLRQKHEYQSVGSAIASSPRSGGPRHDRRNRTARENH